MWPWTRPHGMRLGHPKVKIVCRGMRASFNELT